MARFSGFAHDYDRYRPSPPEALATAISMIARRDKPALVVDLGSGSGLSSRYWSDKALLVIGVEPSEDMLCEAVRQTHSANVRYQVGYSHSTGLAESCAQVVTCVQALHWMEPQATFEEAYRLLQVGGVFAAVDYDWPPMTHSWQADEAWGACNERVSRLERNLARDPVLVRWDKETHLSRMRDSGCFRHVREFVLHHVDQGDYRRFVGLLRSQGGVMDLLKSGQTEHELGIDQLESTARRELGSSISSWYWSSRVRIGVR